MTVVVPVQVLAEEPENVSAPVPVLVRPPVPEVMPENAVEVLSLPAMSVAAPRVALPAPAREPMVWLQEFRSRMAPEEIVTALAAEKVIVAPACRVPTDTVVTPS